MAATLASWRLHRGVSTPASAHGRQHLGVQHLRLACVAPVLYRSPRAALGRHMERWPRGRRRRFAKPLYGPKAVSRVRIPPSPQRFTSSKGPAGSPLTGAPGHGIRVGPYAAIAQLDRASVYGTEGREFESLWP